MKEENIKSEYQRKVDKSLIPTCNIMGVNIAAINMNVDNLWGDPTKAKTVLGWNPQKTSYEELVEIMAKHDRALAKKEAAMKNA